MEFFDDGADLSVGKNRKVGRQSQSLIQDRMVINDARLRVAVCIWPAKSSGMRQLQSDHESFNRTRCTAMLFDQRVAQLCQSCSGVPRNHQLIRIRAALVRNSNGFASPDQFRAALPESLPAPDSVFAGI